MVVMMHHLNPLEVVDTAVEMVDLAWNTIEKRQELAAQDVVYELERELEREHLQNVKLRASLQECMQALEALQSSSPDASSLDTPPKDECVQALEALHSRSPDALSLDTPPRDLCEQLIKKVKFTEFLETLKDLELEKEKDESADSFVKKSTGDAMAKTNTEDHTGWIWVTEDHLASNLKEEHNMLDNDSYLIISQDDVVEGMAFFLARAIYSNPKAQHMTPSELLEALSLSFAKMEAQGTISKLWKIVKYGYISASWSIALYGVYKRPLILRATLRAIFVL